MRWTIFVTFVIFFLALISIGKALTCGVYNNACPSGENCLISMYSPTNSHVATCDYYPYKLCCDEISGGIYHSCPDNMTEILSMYQENNTHVATPGYYGLKLCAGYSTYPVNCHIREGSCLSDETCILSLFSPTNSHVATCDYYPYKLCCQLLPDLYVNESSIQPNETTPTWGSIIDINVTVWNIGDAAADNVNVSCYENGDIFDSKVISSIPAGGEKTVTCKWNVSCKTNISVYVDPENSIMELNESNNEAWKQMNIIDKLLVKILHPNDGDKFYRGETIELNSTTTAHCNNLPSHNTYWYNESTFIGEGDNITWTIPLGDFILGNKTITAYSNETGYTPGEDKINITILNNLPWFDLIQFNVTPPEVESGNGIEMSCVVHDLEDCNSPSNCSLNVNVSIRYPDGTWSNITGQQIGNTFYRDFKAPYHPLGYYTVVCSAVDSDGGYNESEPATFLVWQNGTIELKLNSSKYWWNDSARIEGWAKRLDGTPIANSNVNVSIGDVSTNICPLASTDNYGYFYCDFKTPNAVGDYKLIVEIQDSLTNKIIANTTTLKVSPFYGGSESSQKHSPYVSCYEVPELIQNPDGTVKKVWVKICVWK